MKNNDISVVCVDLNETLVEEQTWPELNFGMGMTPAENIFFYNQHKNGEITYSEWVDAALKIYRERGEPTREAVEKIVMSYTYYPFAKELIKYLQQKYTVILISGAMDLLVQKIAVELDIKYFKSLTKFHFDQHGYISEVTVDDRTGDEAKNKVLYLRDFCTELGFKLDCVSSIGDGCNDQQLFMKTKGITFDRAKVEHKKLAWKVVPGLKEITEILQVDVLIFNSRSMIPKAREIKKQYRWLKVVVLTGLIPDDEVILTSKVWMASLGSSVLESIVFD